MKHIILFILILCTSCASYVEGMHRQIDREEAVAKGKISNERDPYAMYRKNRKAQRNGDQRPIQNPISLSYGSPAGQQDQQPPVKRDYRSTTGQPNTGRVSAKDFVDDGSSGSLWVGTQGTTLFTNETSKRAGDIIVINVLENLRNQISNELKRTFPEPPKPGIGSATADASNPQASGATPASDENELDTKVYDKVSGIVAEEVSRDYLLLRGKKEVIFRKEKRSIEIQALVSRRDILDNDTVNSDKLLESRVFILR